MFDVDLISSIFGNIEDILSFQEVFLKDLSMVIDTEVRALHIDNFSLRQRLLNQRLFSHSLILLGPAEIVRRRSVFEKPSEI